MLHLLSDLAVGGGQSIVMQHVEHSDRDRFDVRVVSLGPDRTLEPWFVAAGTPPVVIDVPAVGRLRSVRRAIAHVRDADVVHIHTDVGRDIGGAAAFWCGVPVVSHLHGEWVHLGHCAPQARGPVRRLRHAGASCARAVLERTTVAHYVAGSRSVAASFQPLVRQPLSVCRPSVSLDAITDARRRRAGEDLRVELGIPPGAPVVLSIARMVVAKGHTELLAMFEALSARHPDAVLVLVGDGPFYAPLLHDLAASSFGDRVRAPGARLDVPSFLAMADVFVHASLTEAFGLVILEAMAAHLPVVAFELPAYADFVVPGASADLVPLGDVAALTDAVSALLTDPERAARLGCYGHALVRERHPRDVVARLFESVYSEVLGWGGHRPLELARERRRCDLDRQQDFEPPCECSQHVGAEHDPFAFPLRHGDL